MNAEKLNKNILQARKRKRVSLEALKIAREQDSELQEYLNEFSITAPKKRKLENVNLEVHNALPIASDLNDCNNEGNLIEEFNDNESVYSFYSCSDASDISDLDYVSDFDFDESEGEENVPEANEHGEKLPDAHDHEEVQLDIKKTVKEWVEESRVPFVLVDSLLKKLKPFHPDLPVTTKTLLGTRYLNKYVIKNTADDGKFVYIGIKKQLERQINPLLHINKKVQL